MKPQNKTIFIYQGQTLRQQFLFVDANGIPIDLSAKTARMQCRPYLESATVLFELNTTVGGIELGADGLLTLGMSAEGTAALSPGKPYDQQWVYDLEISTLPVVDRVLYGAVVFSPEVTRV